MPTKEQRRMMNPEYYKGLALEAIDALADKYPGSSKPSVIRSMVHTLTDDVLKLCLIDKRLHDLFKEFVVDELAQRHPEDGEELMAEFEADNPEMSQEGSNA